MELAQLRYLVAVVEEGGFTRAAERLHVSQPGVSAQIGQLERELGQRLLDRSGRRVAPTEAGEAVLVHARAALAAVEGVRRTADEFLGLVRGRVALGLIPGAAGAAVDSFDLVALLGDFHDAHPRVEISLTEDTSERMLAALREGRLDLAVVGLAGEPPTGIGVRLLLDEPLVAAVRADDPLVGEAVDGTVALTALRGRPLIGLPRGTGVRGVLERACAEAGFTPRVEFEAAAPAVLARLAARGLGVAVVPDGAHAHGGPGLRALRITGPELSGRVALAWRTDGPSGPAARALLGRLRSALPPEPGRTGGP